MHCIHCNSTNTKIHSTRETRGGKSVQHKCKDCNRYFTISTENSDEQYDSDSSVFVITSAQNNTPVNECFLGALENYCDINDAELFVIPLKYNNPNVLVQDNEVLWDELVQDYLLDTNIKVHPLVKIMGSLKINATSDNPLTGLDSLSKGDSVIIGHQQLQMKTLPVQQDDHPVIMTTTGTVTEKNYSISKLGAKADFNHSFSAAVVVVSNGIFHIRHLNFDGTGFYDLDQYYTAVDHFHDTVEAIVTGDEHVIFIDKNVFNATYGKGGLVESLKPRYIVRHDVIDCYSISHHHNYNVFTRYAKAMAGVNILSKELDEVVDFIIKTTPQGTKNIIVSSNHHDHITRWLNECDPKTDPHNAMLYHQLMYEMLKRTSFSKEGGGTYHPNPFELYSEKTFISCGLDVEFLSRSSTFKILGVEIASHGDKGNNGSRGSRPQYANLPSKTIIGHSHSPGITKGCYQVGTSSTLKLEYNQGASSWLNTHCIIHRNGKRQLVNIINGKWK